MRFSVDLLKKADAELPESSRKELESVMARIYDEAPWKWPYGLSINAHDEIYMIRKTASLEPVGFTGWQERYDGLNKVGFYTVGILPEYRGHGMAKEAVGKLIAKKANEVDQVRAMIVEGNTESEHLANTLGVDYHLKKKASTGKMLASMLAGGVGNTVMWDQALHPDKSIKETLDFSSYDKPRGIMAGLNFLLGATGGGLMASGAHTLRAPLQAGEKASEKTLKGVGLLTGGISPIALAPAKDLIVQGLPVPQKVLRTLDSVNEKITQPEEEGMSNKQKIILGLLGAAGIGAGAFGVNRLAKAVEDNANASQKARVRITLPTKDPSDTETVVDAPLTDLNLSAKAYRDLGRDTRRKIRSETKDKTLRRKIMHMQEDNVQKVAAQVGAAQAKGNGQNVMQPVARTPWAASYSQKQMPTPTEPDQNVSKQIEEAHAKIDALTQKMQLKDVKDQAARQTGQGKPASDATPAPSFNSSGIQSRMNSALKLIGAGKVKQASTLPSSTEPDHSQKKLPLQTSEIQSGYDLGNRSFMGKPGIQAPITPRNAAFGKNLYQIGALVNKSLNGGPQPSARGMFMDTNPPNLSFEQKVIDVLPQFASLFVR